MQIAVSSLVTSLDSWAGMPFGVCSQFLIVDTENMEFLVVSVPQQEQDPSKISLYAIRAIADSVTRLRKMSGLPVLPPEVGKDPL